MGLTLLVGVIVAVIVVAAFAVQKQFRHACLAGMAAFTANAVIYRLWVAEVGSLVPARIVFGTFCLLVVITVVYVVGSFVLAISHDMDS
jgi:hypothetical protein